MFSKTLLVKNIARTLFVSTRQHQVTVLGGATDIGQSICLLLRSQPNITKLIIHDSQPQTKGVTLDLSHVPTNATIKGYVGNDTLETALKNSEIVIGAGGISRQPGINEKLWFTTNTNFIKTAAREISRLKSMPFVGIVTNPINSLVPMAAEVMRNHGDFDPKKLFGITNIDALRAQALFAADHNLDPNHIYIPVIGGHSKETSIPLLSQVPNSDLKKGGAEEFIARFRKCHDDVRKAKRGFSPSLSVAYSALLFTRSILDVLDGKQASIASYVENNDFGTEYFSGLVHINQDGVKEMQRYPNLSHYECHLLEQCIIHLRRDILKGKKILEYV